MMMFKIIALCTYLLAVCAQENADGKTTTTVTTVPTTATNVTTAATTVTTGTTNATTSATTPKPKPTTKPTPTPNTLPKYPPIQSLYVREETVPKNNCILFQGGIRLGFNYTVNTTQYNQSYVDVYNPGTNETVWLNVTGSCGNKTDVIVIPVNDGHNSTLTLTFTKNTSKSENDVSLTNIAVNYTTTDKTLPKYSNKSDIGTFTVNFNLTELTTTHGHGYRCESESEIKVKPTKNSGPLFEIMTHMLQVDVFRRSNDTKFYEDYQQCKADNKVSNIVPIAVGAALGALVLIVLIAYLVGRKRNQRGYESV